MGVLTKAQNNTSHPSKKEASSFRVKTLLDAVSLVAMGVTFFLLLGYLVAAFQWQNRPFLGAMFTESLTVTDAKPFSDESWSALDAGLQVGDQVLGINGQEWMTKQPATEFADTLADLQEGQTVTLSVSREGDTPETWQCDTPTEGKSFCTVPSVRLTNIPSVDFFLHFGVGYLVAIVVFLIGAAVLWQRFESTAAKSFAIGAAALAVVVVGRFDLMTTFWLIPAWIAASFVFSTVLLTFALVYPSNLPFMYRAPSLRFAPLIAGTVLTVASLWLYYNSTSDTTLLIPLAVMLGAVTVLMLSMFWRRSTTTSPVIHEQSSFVALGTLVAFTPFALWVIYFVLSGGHIINEITPLMQATVIVYALSTAYAVLQYRLLQTDRIIPEFIVYSILTGLLVIGYLLVTVALGIGIVDFLNLEADSPILIALTIGVIAALFGPARSYLRQAIDEVMFRQRRSYQQRMEAFNRQLTSAVTLDDILTVVKSELEETLNPDAVLLFLFDSKTGSYTAWPDPRTGKAGTDITFRGDGGLIEYLSEEQTTLYLEAGQPLPMVVAPDRSQLAVLAMPLFVRLKGRERPNGILCLGTQRNGSAYDYEDLRFIENLADQTAAAVDRAKFVNDLEQRVRIQDVLSQVSHALNYAISFDDLLELIFAQTLRIINADHFYIVLRDLLTNELYYSFYSTRDERLYGLENRRWKMGRDVIGEVARRQIPMRLENFTAEQLKRDPKLATNSPDIYAWIGVPLITDTATGGALGVMAIGASDPSITFTDEQRQLFSDIANIAASAIDKTQLFKKTEVRAAQLKALNDISGLLASELEDVDRLLEIITESAVSILGCEAGSLLLVDEKSRDLVFRVATGGKGSDLIGQRISRDEPSLVAEAVTKIQPVIVNNPAQDSRWHGDLVDTDLGDSEVFRSKALLTVPLVAQGEAVGALQVINKRDGSPFTDEDAELANTFAGQAAVAIQNARLFASQDQQLLMRVQELEGMAQIDHSLNQTLLLDRLSDIVMGWALKQTGATHGAIFLLDEEDEKLRLIFSHGYPEEGSLFSLPEGQAYKEFPANLGILGRVVATNSPAMITDVKHDPTYVESLSGCVAQIAVPLVSGAEVNGVILIETIQEGKLGLLEFNFLSRLTDRASSAISNALLFTQLSELQKSRVRFVREIAHELGNALAPMKGYVGLISRVGELNTQQQNFIKTVSRNIETMQRLITDMREVEMLSAGQSLVYHPASINFNDVLNDVLSNLQQDFENKDQVVVVNTSEELPEIWVDEVRLNQVLTNFLTNANKYTPEDGEVVVFAEVADNEWDADGVRRVLHIGVKDNGLGISKEDQKKMFQPYFRSTNPKARDEQKGTGVGLSLTRSLIEQQGGRIWLESDLGQGSTFHFTIPLASEVLTERA